MKVVIKDVRCPKCGALEMHSDGDKLQIRAFKMYINNHWESQCLVCSGGYDKVNGTFTEANHNSEKGWF